MYRTIEEDKAEEVMRMRKVVLPGGSGFLGEALADYLIARGYEVVILTRSSSRGESPRRYVQWDGKTRGDWVREISGSTAVVNFTGKSVNCIYTPKNKQEILQSRLDSVGVLHDVIKSSDDPPNAFIQAGSLAIFGDTTDVCDETAPHGTGFSVDVCQRWEEAFFSQEHIGTRRVLLRIGFALGKNGGALEPLRKLANRRLGGTVGSGKQYISWIHLDDLNEMFLTVIEQEEFEGIFNATGPSPVTNKEFMKTLRFVLNKGWSPKAPTPLVKLGAYVIMRAAPELALTGRRCVPDRFLRRGFTFRYMNLEQALQEIINE
ncbi:TIGR01777 family oxidoreductase [Priestia koreensis]|uniref:TIGR01777 family oxidoreductase n=1 Tax=Priestia koreensis TaxID=284581 RepID=UPI001F5AED82|nr:TIGR01777 family oxidoreductase [Priestia koreensis]MCM3004952.1 TIGR01777 family oxidoreductase [Priestia koreensis]